MSISQRPRSSAFGQAYQRGLLAIDALIFSSFILIVIGIGSWVLGEISKTNQARATGNYLVQYATAVRLALSDQGAVLVGTNESTADWLKPVTGCAGTAPEPYMPNCGFPDTDPAFGLTVTTVVTAGGSGETIATISMDAETLEGERSQLQQILQRIEMGDPVSNANFGNTFVTAELVDDADGDTDPDTVQVTVATNDIDEFIRADGTQPWNPNVTQDASGAEFINIGSLTGDPTAPGAALITMSSFVDADDNNFELDPNDASVLNSLDVTSITNDPILTQIVNPVTGNSQRLSQVVTHTRGVVASGDTVSAPTCTAPGSSPEIQGWVVGIVANDGTYSDPKNLKGFNVYATGTGPWTVMAKAFIDDEDVNYEIDPGGLALIGYMTSCSNT